MQAQCIVELLTRPLNVRYKCRMFFLASVDVTAAAFWCGTRQSNAEIDQRIRIEERRNDRRGCFRHCVQGSIISITDSLLVWSRAVFVVYMTDTKNLCTFQSYIDLLVYIDTSIRRCED